jgi:hypothetical protein
MKKNLLLLLSLVNHSSIFTSAPPASAVEMELSKAELALINTHREQARVTWQEESSQLRMKVEGQPPFRGISSISAAIPQQVFFSTTPSAPPRHIRQRSNSNPSLLVQSSEVIEPVPEYSLIPTGANTDQLLELANKELEAAVLISASLAQTLKKELLQAAQRHQSITVGTLSPSLPKRGNIKTAWDFVRRKTETDRRGTALKLQTRQASKTEQESREAITPLVARVLTVKERMLDLEAKVIVAAQASAEKHKEIKTRSESFRERKGSKC